MAALTPQEKVQKLALYATVKSRLANPSSFIEEEGTVSEGLSLAKLSTLYSKLRKELKAAGLEKEVLDLSGDQLSEVICETFMRRQKMEE